MLMFAISVLVGGLVVLVGELARRRLGESNEVSRKLVHFVHGMLVAYWPFVIGYKMVIGLEVVFLFAVFAAHKLHLFKWMEKVGRISWGQYTFSLGVIAAALMANSKWVYLAAILELAIADAAAAIIGKKYGRNTFYRVLGQQKSVVGSLTFYTVSLLVIGWTVILGPISSEFSNVALVAIFLPAALTAMENLGVYGMDNLLLPVFTALALNALM